MLTALQNLLVELGGLSSAFGGVFSADANTDGISDMLIGLLMPIANATPGTGGLGPLLISVGGLLGSLGTAA